MVSNTKAESATVPFRYVVALVTTHLFVGLAAAYFSDSSPAISSGIFIAIVFAQSTLIGIWWGLGETSWKVRVPACLVAAVALDFELAAGVGQMEFYLLLLGILPTLLVYGVATGLRFFCRIQRLEDPHNEQIAEGLQFSILHLILFTTAIAILMGIGKAVVPKIGSLEIAVQICVMAVCYATIGVVVLWAVLGQRSVLLRVATAIAVAVVAGFTMANVGRGTEPFWAMTVVGQAVVAIASMGAIRFMGYRLVRRNLNP